MKQMLTLLLLSFLIASVAQAEELSDDSYCLAQNLYHEARGEHPSGVVAVGNVVLNRVQSKRFPNTICEVVKQGGQRRHKCQFSWYCDGRSDQTRDKASWQEMVWISELLLSGRIADNTDGALFYHTDGVDPYWNADMTPKMMLGVHIFY
ncbi:hypothetical protein LCGC14_1770920 [marine sediment metagenome]|uniref:Cell wall hydrolase SleB domain-containing protein n=1 Tax=marine sediment metagenome TaxID=412755 RepID=A0A0F9JD87_9ZZZZ